MNTVTRDEVGLFRTDAGELLKVIAVAKLGVEEES
jgi:hypothetical protein